MSHFNKNALGLGYFLINDGANRTFTNPQPNFIHVTNAGASGIIITLATAGNINSIQSKLIPRFQVYNQGTQNVTVVDALANVVGIVPPAGLADFVLSSNTVGANDGSYVFKLIYNDTSSGYFLINDGVSKNLTNPMPTLIDVTNAGAGLNVVCAPMNQPNSLLSTDNSVLYIYNRGNQTVNFRNNSNTATLAAVSPGKFFQLIVTGNGDNNGSFTVIDTARGDQAGIVVSPSLATLSYINTQPYFVASSYSLTSATSTTYSLPNPQSAREIEAINGSLVNHTISSGINNIFYNGALVASLTIFAGQTLKFKWSITNTVWYIV